MNYCPNCGKPVEAETKFCANCGTALARLPSAVQPSSLQCEQSATQAYAKPAAFSFSGRARRTDYCVMALACGFAIAVATGFVLSNLGEGEDAATFFLASCVMLGIPLLVWSFAVQVRRSHDLGWSGWMVLIQLVPYIGWLASLVFFFAFAFVDGQPGPNRFGPDPKGRRPPWKTN